MKNPINWHAMTDDEFVKACETQIWLSSFASNNPRAPAHKEVDLAYNEAVRRGKTWLYQRAWNAAYRSCGYTPSEHDIELAKEPNNDEQD